MPCTAVCPWDRGTHLNIIDPAWPALVLPYPNWPRQFDEFNNKLVEFLINKLKPDFVLQYLTSFDS